MVMKETKRKQKEVSTLIFSESSKTIKSRKMKAFVSITLFNNRKKK